MDGDETAPLIRCDLPKLEWALPAIRTDCTGADPGIVDQDIDAAEPGTGRSGNLVGGRVRGQIGLDGDQLGGPSLLTGARRKRL
jgi:hypothetical protein